LVSSRYLGYPIPSAAPDMLSAELLVQLRKLQDLQNPLHQQNQQSHVVSKKDEDFDKLMEMDLQNISAAFRAASRDLKYEAAIADATYKGRGPRRRQAKRASKTAEVYQLASLRLPAEEKPANKSKYQPKESLATKTEATPNALPKIAPRPTRRTKLQFRNSRGGLAGALCRNDHKDSPQSCNRCGAKTCIDCAIPVINNQEWCQNCCASPFSQISLRSAVQQPVASKSADQAFLKSPAVGAAPAPTPKVEEPKTMVPPKPEDVAEKDHIKLTEAVVAAAKATSAIKKVPSVKSLNLEDVDFSNLNLQLLGDDINALSGMEESFALEPDYTSFPFSELEFNNSMVSDPVSDPILDGLDIPSETLPRKARSVGFGFEPSSRRSSMGRKMDPFQYDMSLEKKLSLNLFADSTTDDDESDEAGSESSSCAATRSIRDSDNDSPMNLWVRCRAMQRPPSDARTHISSQSMPNPTRKRRRPDGQQFQERPSSIKRKTVKRRATGSRNLSSAKKRFFCQHCDKGFKQRSNLVAHIRIHTGEKPFKCTHCERGFAQKSNLKRHLRVHESS